MLIQVKRDRSPLRRQRERGATLIEAMVGITIGLIILAGVVTMSLQISQSGIDNVRASRLNQQVRLAMDHLTQEIQRAGFVELWDIATPPVAAADLNEELMALVGQVRLFKFPTRGNASSGTPTLCTTADADCDCILFSYDFNKDGFQGVGTSGTVSDATLQNTANFELYGFRWNGGAIERRQSGDTHTCNSGTWEDATDGDIVVTNLDMQLLLPVFADEPNNPIEIDGDDDGTCETSEICLIRRSVQVDLSARLSTDATVDRTVSNEIKVKNDYYYTAP